MHRQNLRIQVTKAAMQSAIVLACDRLGNALLPAVEEVLSACEDVGRGSPPRKVVIHLGVHFSDPINIVCIEIANLVARSLIGGAGLAGNASHTAIHIEHHVVSIVSEHNCRLIGRQGGRDQLSILDGLELGHAVYALFFASGFNRGCHVTTFLGSALA